MRKRNNISYECSKTVPTGTITPFGLLGFIPLLLFLAAGATLPATGQGITDSIFSISEVAVTRTTSFLKEQAGMKESTIDTLILKHQVHTNLSRLLAENSNIHIRDYGRGALSTASFRGTAPSHTQVSWNGLSINSPMLGMVDFSLVPVFIIDELNVHHGAASVASRSGGLGGEVEIKNLPDWSNRTGGRIYMDYGSFGTAGGMAQLNLGSTKFQSKTRFYRSGSENNYPFVNKNIIEKDPLTGELSHPIQENRNAAYLKTGATQEFYWRPTKRPPGNSILSNRTWVQVAGRSVPAVMSSEYSVDGVQHDNRQEDLTLKNVTAYSYYGDGAKVELRTGIDYQRLGYLMETEVIGLNLQKNVNSESRMLSWYNSGQLKHQFSKRLSIDTRAAFNRYDIATYDSAIHTGYDTVRTEASFFGGIYFSAAEPLQLSVQLRKDFVSDHRAPLIYTLGASYRPIEKHDLLIKGNFARNYHHPTLNDLYWQPGGNPDLLPEEGYSGEITVQYAAASKGRSVSTALTGYHARIADWILWLPGFKGYWEPVNVAEVRSSGLEYHLAVNVKIRQTALQLNGNMALTHTRNAGHGVRGVEDEVRGTGDEVKGVQLPFIPKVSGNAFVSVMNRGWYLQWQYNAMGTRQLMSSGDGGPTDDSSELPGLKETDRLYSLYPYYMNNLKIGKGIDIGSSKKGSNENNGSNGRGIGGNKGNRITKFSPKKISIELRIDNLFNETYRNELQRFMPGRSYTIHLKYDF